MTIFRRSALAVPLAAALAAGPAQAHVVAGARVFPVTLTFDDPGVGDEVSVPAFTWTRSGADGGTGPTHESDLGFEWDKTITPDTAIIFNDGYDIQHVEGTGTQAGWENLFVTGKWQAVTNAAHEFVASLGLTREFGGSGTTHVGADRFGATSGNLYAGKGMGDLGAPLLRPFAVTGELTYTVADKELKALVPEDVTEPGAGLQFNNGNSNGWTGGISIQYSLPYLQSQVRDVGLRGLFADLVPIIEFGWTSPASSPSTQPTTWVAAPGVIYQGGWGEVGIEALIPLDRAGGTNVGVVGLVHLFLDDLAPHSLGRPLFR